MISALVSLLWSVKLSHIGLAVFVLIILVPALQFIYNVTLHPLANYPGPLLYAGSNIPSVISRIRGRPVHKMLELHQKYGPVVRYAPNEVTYISAQAWKDIYGHRKGQLQMPPNPSYGVRELDFFGSLSFVWEVDFHEHARRRRLLGEGFSDKSLREQEPIIRKYANLLMQRMEENAGKTINLAAWFNYTTFDIIGDLTFGEPFHCLQNSSLHPWIYFLFSNLNLMMYGQITAAMGLSGKVIEMLAPRRLKEAAMNHAKSTIKKVDLRRHRSTNRPDFMTHILQEASKTGGPNLSKLYADSNILVIAGSETSATLLSAASFHLMRNPRTLHRLQAEVRAAYSSEHDINFETVSKLPYLGAVLNEALRIHPPLPAGIIRRVPPGGAVVDGRFVPAGTSVHIPQWAAFKWAANFVDPECFVPERWLPGEPGAERYAGDNREVFQPFSAGTRNCIGRSLAYMETRMVLSRLVWGFDMRLMEDSVEWNDMRVFVLYEKREMNAVLTRVVREGQD